MSGVYEELQHKRAEMMDEDASSSTTLFHVKLLGSARAKAKLGTAVDAWGGKVQQGSKAEQFCRLHRFNLSAQFAIRLFGNDEARMLAKEWCNRMQYIFDLWQEQGNEGVRPYDAAAMHHYTELNEFTALAAGAAGELQTRVDKIRMLRPA